MAVKEALENATVALINKTVTGIDTAVNFLSTEIPEVIKQLLMWNFAQSIMYSVFYFFCIISVAYSWKVTNKFYKNRTGYSRDPSIFLIPGCYTVLGLAWFIPDFMKNILEAVKIWIAPKVWLIEYAAELAKKVSN